MIDWLLEKLAYAPRTTKPEELEERVESIERDLAEHDGPHAHA
jgi:hypothetical protein